MSKLFYQNDTIHMQLIILHIKVEMNSELLLDMTGLQLSVNGSLSGSSVCTDPVAGTVGWDVTHSQSDWTHPLKTQQLSGTLWEI